MILRETKFTGIVIRKIDDKEIILESYDPDYKCHRTIICDICVGLHPSPHINVGDEITIDGFWHAFHMRHENMMRLSLLVQSVIFHKRGLVANGY